MTIENFNELIDGLLTDDEEQWQKFELCLLYNEFTPLQASDLKNRVEDFCRKHPDSAIGLTLEGMLYHRGIGVSRDYGRAIERYEQAILKEYARAMYRRAFMHEFVVGQGGTVDYPSAIALYERAIAKGDTEAMFYRAQMHHYGHGGAVDDPSAIALYELAIAKGHAGAMFYRAQMHHFGHGGAIDYPRAIALYEQAIAKGHAGAMFYRAQMHQLGRGGEIDYIKSAQLYFQAYHKGYKYIDCLKHHLHEISTLQISDNLAQTYLFIIYTIGLRTKPDTQKAADYLDKKPSSILSHLYQTILNKTIPLSPEDTHTLLKRAILHPKFAESIQPLTGAQKEELFAATIQTSKTNILNGSSIGERKNDWAVLKTLASLQIYDDQDFRACQKAEANRLGRLVSYKQGCDAHLCELETLAADGNDTAAQQLADYYEGVSKRLLEQAQSNDKKAKKAYQSLVTLSKKRSEACVSLGIYHQHKAMELVVGAGLFASRSAAKHRSDAFKYFSEAAAKDNKSGLFHLGFCYEQGIGVEQDKPKALDYYLRAATLDCAEALSALKVVSFDENQQLATTALMYQGISIPLLGKAYDFYENYSLKEAFDKDRTHFALETLRLANDSHVPLEKQVALLQIVLQHYKKETVHEEARIKLQHLFSVQAAGLGKFIEEKKKVVMPPSFEAIEAEAFVDCALVFTDNHDNDLKLRIFILVVAQQKAQNANINACEVNERLKRLKDMPKQNVTEMESLLSLPSVPPSLLPPSPSEGLEPPAGLSNASQTSINETIKSEIAHLSEEDGSSPSLIAAALSTLINEAEDFNAYSRLSPVITFGYSNPMRLHGDIKSNMRDQAKAYFEDSIRKRIEELNKEADEKRQKEQTLSSAPPLTYVQVLLPSPPPKLEEKSFNQQSADVQKVPTPAVEKSDVVVDEKDVAKDDSFKGQSSSQAEGLYPKLSDVPEQILGSISQTMKQDPTSLNDTSNEQQETLSQSAGTEAVTTVTTIAQAVVPAAKSAKTLPPPATAESAKRLPPATAKSNADLLTALGMLASAPKPPTNQLPEQSSSEQVVKVPKSTTPMKLPQHS